MPRIRNILDLVILVCCLAGGVLGNAACRSDRDCPLSSGKQCIWMFEGCATGRCMCDPRTHRHDVETDSCYRVSKGREYCKEDKYCVEGMECYNNQCECPLGTKMTEDGRACLGRSHRLLGDSCVAGVDTCWHKPQFKVTYTTNRQASCKDGLCECTSGLKQTGLTCSKWLIGETGCRKSHHCQGGALCLDRKCQCPSGYFPTAANTKCAKYGAQTGLIMGQVCDEIGESRYCSHDLTCNQCDGKQHYTCARFALTGEDFQPSSASQLFSYSAVFLIPFLTSVL